MLDPAEAPHPRTIYAEGNRERQVIIEMLGGFFNGAVFFEVVEVLAKGVPLSRVLSALARFGGHVLADNQRQHADNTQRERDAGHRAADVLCPTDGKHPEHECPAKQQATEDAPGGTGGLWAG